LNKKHKSQVAPLGRGEIGVRAGDNTLVPFVARIDSGHNSEHSSGSDDDEENHHNNNGDLHAAELAAAVQANEETVRLHELIAHPGVFQILVFTGNQWKTIHQPDSVIELAKSMDFYLPKWRQNWPSNRDDKIAAALRSQFMVHTMTTLTPEKAPVAVDTLASKLTGEGKAYRDLGKELHHRYGVDTAVKKNPEGGAIIVVRPDSHIGYRVQGTGSSAWHDVNEYFESILV